MQCDPKDFQRIVEKIDSAGTTHTVQFIMLGIWIGVICAIICSEVKVLIDKFAEVKEKK